MDEEVIASGMSSNPVLLAQTFQWGVKKYTNQLAIADPLEPCA